MDPVDDRLRRALQKVAESPDPHVPPATEIRRRGRQQHQRRLTVSALAAVLIVVAMGGLVVGRISPPTELGTAGQPTSDPNGVTVGTQPSTMVLSGPTEMEYGASALFRITLPPINEKVISTYLDASTLDNRLTTRAVRGSQEFVAWTAPADANIPVNQEVQISASVSTLTSPRLLKSNRLTVRLKRTKSTGFARSDLVATPANNLPVGGFIDFEESPGGNGQYFESGEVINFLGVSSMPDSFLTFEALKEVKLVVDDGTATSTIVFPSADGKGTVTDPMAWTAPTVTEPNGRSYWVKAIQERTDGVTKTTALYHLVVLPKPHPCLDTGTCVGGVATGPPIPK